MRFLTHAEQYAPVTAKGTGSQGGCGQLDIRSTRPECRVDSFTKKSTRHKSTRHKSQLDTRSTRHIHQLKSIYSAI